MVNVRDAFKYSEYTKITGRIYGRDGFQMENMGPQILWKDLEATPTFLSSYTSWLVEKQVERWMRGESNIREFLRLSFDMQKDLILESVEQCNKCQLFCNRHVLPQIVDSEFLFVGRNPSVKGVTLYTDIMYKAVSQQTLFDKYLLTLGLDRDKVAITHIVLGSTNQNVYPSRTCQEVCSMWLYLMFRMMTKLKYIFTLGQDALRVMTGSNISLTGAYGTLYNASIEGAPYKIVPIHHPGYLQINPQFAAFTADILRVVKEDIHANIGNSFR